ncbi:hypothetical protein [Actinoplanes sp. NPDC051494]|uniref:hypothetical protein n=1 Tax=Actinoplanes sp. NPDC051494 TaxID=3363907 RepID=UPI0037B46C7A
MDEIYIALRVTLDEDIPQLAQEVTDLNREIAVQVLTSISALMKEQRLQASYIEKALEGLPAPGAAPGVAPFAVDAARVIRQFSPEDARSIAEEMHRRGRAAKSIPMIEGRLKDQFEEVLDGWKNVYSSVDHRGDELILRMAEVHQVVARGGSLAGNFRNTLEGFRVRVSAASVVSNRAPAALVDAGGQGAGRAYRPSPAQGTSRAVSR